MKGPLPYLIRRLVWIPLFVIAVVSLIAAVPVWLLVAAFASRFVPGRWRILRVTWFLIVYLVFDAAMILVLFGLWLASGFGWKLSAPAFQQAHYSLAGWWLRRIVGSAKRTFNLTFANDDSAGPVAEQGAALAAGSPLLLFSRHAGPGDSVLLVDAALNQLGRRPRIILKDLLKMEPVIDIVLNRLPNYFVPSSGSARSGSAEAIGRLAGGLGADDCLILFPEGGNYTQARHERAVEKLEASGRPALASRARRMEHLLPPKPTGALTAIEAAPDASIAFIGHVGLERLSTLGDLWRGIPMDSTVVTRVWLVPPAEVPPQDEREHWLYDRWAEMDAWIDAQLDEEAVAADDGDADR
ncbi:MAG: 1-acyl-sn-glycerol-3-phosphate acyltransferase [Acidimicrobiales bacterium]